MNLNVNPYQSSETFPHADLESAMYGRSVSPFDSITFTDLLDTLAELFTGCGLIDACAHHILKCSRKQRINPIRTVVLICNLD